MNPEIKKLWITALTNGQYKQGKLKLKYENNKIICHCAAGVLAQIAIDENVVKEKYNQFSKEYAIDESWCFLTNKILIWAELDDSNISFIIEMNDKLDMSFEELAIYIKDNL